MSGFIFFIVIIIAIIYTCFKDRETKEDLLNIFYALWALIWFFFEFIGSVAKTLFNNIIDIVFVFLLWLLLLWLL